jgi:hypothetical protein
MRRNEGRNRSRAALSRETCSHTTRFLLSLPQSSSPRPPRPIWRLYHRPRIAINRSAAGRTDMLTDKAMNRIDARRMVQRRSAGHGMRIAAHTFSPPASLPISKPAGRSRTRKSWPRMKARARQNSIIAPATRLPSMRSSELRSDRRRMHCPPTARPCNLVSLARVTRTGPVLASLMTCQKINESTRYGN